MIEGTGKGKTWCAGCCNHALASKGNKCKPIATRSPDPIGVQIFAPTYRSRGPGFLLLLLLLVRRLEDFARVVSCSVQQQQQHAAVAALCARKRKTCTETHTDKQRTHKSVGATSSDILICAHYTLAGCFRGPVPCV